MPWKAIRIMIIVTLLLLIAILLAAAWFSKRYRAEETNAAMSGDLREVEVQAARRLREDVRMLAGTIGERNMWNFDRLEKAAVYIEEELREAGWAVGKQEYVQQGKTVRNIIAEVEGSESPQEIVLIGAHYDSVIGSPGANDNASGVAALLELARALAGERPRRTLRLAAFTNEEPPFFQTSEMGSRVYARAAKKKGEKIVAMVSLETIGYYSEAEESQMFPFPPLRYFYPTRGYFVAFVSNFRSRSLLQRALKAFRASSDFSAEGLTAPEWLMGVNWSDQWSFWRSGYPAIMITDTAPFRYPHYHTQRDTPDKIDYDALARVAAGLTGMTRTLAGF